MYDDLRDDGEVRRLAAEGVDVFIAPEVWPVLQRETVTEPQVKEALRLCSTTRRTEPGRRYDCQAPDNVGRLLEMLVEIAEKRGPDRDDALLVEALRVHRGAWSDDNL